MSRMFVAAVGLGLIASTALAVPAESSTTTTPTTSLQEAWTIPAPSPTGSVISVRPPGLYYSPDSSRLYSLLDRRSLGGYGCDGGEGSRFETIDAATGAVVSSTVLALPPKAPVHHYAMDDAAQRIVVNTGCLEKYLWTSYDAATGARISQWQKDTWADRVAMGVDPNVIFIITGRGKVANGDYRKIVEAVDTSSGRTLWSRTLEGAPTYQGGWVSSTMASGRQYEGQPMAVSADGSRLFVLRWWSNQVEVINAVSGSSEGLIDLPASQDLRNIVASPVDPRAFVTDWTNNRIHVIDTEARSVVKTLPVDGRCLESVAIDATGELLAVNAACDQPRVLLIRSADGSKANEVAVPGDVTQLAVAPNGRGMVIARNANLAGVRVTEILPATSASKKVRPIPAPTDPRNVAAAPATSSAVVTWLAPANAKRAKVTSYRVTARPGGDTCTVKARAPLTCTFSGLTPGRRYVFQVQARNSAQFGLKSDSAIVTIPVPTPVAPPSPEKPQQEFT